MTPHQISLVEASFQSVVPIRTAAAEIFYRRLFERDPALRGMFSTTDMAEQGRKLMASLGFVVQNLRRPDTMIPAVEQLARRHVYYGVRPEHYGTVGMALLDTLEEGLGERFAGELREAWTAAYSMLAGAMMAAAYGAGRRTAAAR